MSLDPGSRPPRPRLLGGSSTAAFLHRLGEHLEAGFDAIQALQLAQPPAPASRRERARRHLREGASLASAIEILELLPPASIATLRAAEQAGRLPRLLARLAQRCEEDVEQRNQLARRLIYPTLLLFLAPLPASIPHMLASSKNSGGGPWLLYAGLVITLTALAILARRMHSSGPLSLFALRVPLVGTWVRSRAIGDYLEALAGLYGAGIPLAKAHGEAATPLASPSLRMRLLAIEPNLLAGSSLAEELVKTGLFQTEEILLLATGERAGSLEENLERMAELAHRNAHRAASQLVRVLAACAYAAAFLAVLYAALAFYTSYFNLLDNLVAR